MIGVCIGVGPEWRQAAEWACNHMQTRTGLECKIVSESPVKVEHPSWIKCHVLDLFPDHDEFLVFDGDLIPVKNWRPDLIFGELGRPFCCCPDRNWIATLNECRRYNLGWPDLYCNFGLTIFGREHKPFWEAVWTRHPNGGSWQEQTCANQILVTSGIEVCRLPRRFNQLVDGSNPVQRSRAVNLHLAGLHRGSVEFIADYYRKIHNKTNAIRDESLTASLP